MLQRPDLWSFAQKRSAAAGAPFSFSHIQQHLDRNGDSIRDLVWQTDNGVAFKGDFPKALGTASIPHPARCP